MTEKIVFARFDYVTQRVICEQMIERECARLRALGLVLELGSDNLETLVREGYITEALGRGGWAVYSRINSG